MSDRLKLMEQLILRCQRSSMFFIENFCKVQHPKAGVLPFKLFKYQKTSLDAFLTSRWNLYRKCRQCFRGDSMVWTPTGPRRIDSIKPGDLVYSLDEKTGSLIVVPVDQNHNNGVANCVEVRTKTGHRSVCTPDHEFLTKEGYRHVNKLTQDNYLIEVNDPQRSSRKKGELKSIKRISGKHLVYDLTIPMTHNYIVDGVVVHNCGISTLAGAFALWYGMFFPQKTILIVSKRDIDAMAFLNKNIKFVYEHLPLEFKTIYGDPPPVWNEHTVGFSNGSTIKSLTSAKDTVRSNSASLNILDEVAFMPKMVEMWSAGQPVMIHGGSIIAITTTNGMDSWYQPTWEDAINKRNDFNPIVINWWDMDWKISYKDDLSGNEKIICPTEGIRKCETKEDIEKWGQYYSPWLEEQYVGLQQRGEVDKFQQEILAARMKSVATEAIGEVEAGM